MEISKITIFQKISKSAIQYIDFNRKFFSSQINHRNEHVLFRIVRTTPFHRVLTHFCERYVSRVINKNCFGPGRPPPPIHSGKKYADTNRVKVQCPPGEANILSNVGEHLSMGGGGVVYVFLTYLYFQKNHF